MDFVVEVLGDFLVEAGFHGAILLRSRVGRAVVASVVKLAAGTARGPIAARRAIPAGGPTSAGGR